MLVLSFLQLSTSAAQNNPLIIVGGAEVNRINSVGGVEVDVYWKNNSNKEIKYITFAVQPYNSVGDMVSSEIGETTAYLKVTGPIAPNMPASSKYTINAFYKAPDTAGYGKGSKSWVRIGWYYKQGHNLADVEKGMDLDEVGYFTYYSYAEDKNFRISEENMEYIMGKTSWDPVWYNNTVSSIRVISVKVDWMDGTTNNYTGDSLKSIYRARPLKQNSSTTSSEAHTLTIKTNGNGKATSSLQIAKSGEHVTLKATANEGYKFKQWVEERNGEIYLVGVSSETDYIMPNYSVELQAVFEKI